MIQRWSLLAVLVLLTACGTATPTSAPTAPAPTSAPASRQTITVFAAASLTDAFEDAAQAFEAANTGVDVVFSFAGSQQLAAQLGEGAPADVFASANARQMQVATDSGRIAADASAVFARNDLVLVVPADNPASISSVDDLARPGLKLVLADRSVPVGQYTLDMLAKASARPGTTATFSETVIANVVSYEDNVRSVLTKVALGEADAGVVYRTDAASSTDVQPIDIPADLNVIASYPIALVSDSTHPELARTFIAFVQSPEGQAILQRYGFLPAS